MADKPNPINLKSHRKNAALFDFWSIVHIFIGVVLVYFLSPFLALILMVLWEPFENLILSPLLAKKGILFGHETLANSLSDIVFDVIGVSVGYFLFVV